MKTEKSHYFMLTSKNVEITVKDCLGWNSGQILIGHPLHPDGPQLQFDILDEGWPKEILQEIHDLTKKALDILNEK